MRNEGLDDAQTGIKIAGRNISKLRYADDTTLMAESEEELKSLLMKVKEENEKFGLKLNIQKTKIMASGPITSWQIDGETVADFIFLGCKITAYGDSSHEITRRLLLGRKVMTNLDSLLKSRDITLSTKVRLVKAVVLPVVVWLLCCDRLGAGGEGNDRGWDGRMASLTQWTWVWVNSRSWWWTGRPVVLQSMGPQSQTRLSNWTELNWCMDVRVGLWRKLSTEELMLLNCGVGEDSWESLGFQGDPASPS